MTAKDVNYDEIYDKIIKKLSDIHGEDIEVYFENMGLKDVIKKNLYLEKITSLGDFKNSLIDIVKNNIFTSLLYYFLWPKIYNLLKLHKYNNYEKVFFSFANNHLNSLTPLANNDNSNSIVLTSITGHQYSQNKSNNAINKNILYIDGFATISDFMNYKKRYIKANEEIYDFFASLAKNYNLNLEQVTNVIKNIFIFYYMNFFRYCLIADRLASLFSTCKFYFGNDSCHRSRAIISAARKAGILSVVIQHGVIANTKLYLPYADKIAVWGEIEKQKLCRAGVESARIVVTGSPTHTKCQPLKKQKIDNLKILYATTPLDSKERHRILKNVITASKELGAELTIRPHPSENYEFYYINNKINYKYKVDNKTLLKVQLDKANIGIIISSTVALDMALHGLLILKYELSTLQDDTRFSDFNYIKSVRNSIDIVDYITTPHKCLEKDRIIFLNNYISRFSTESINEIFSI